MSEVLKKYRKAILDCILVPNALLPVDYHDNKTLDKAVSLAILEKKVEKKERKVLEKAAKEKNRIEHSKRVAAYAQQAIGVDAESKIELDYDVNENRLYHNQLVFVAKMMNAARYDEKIIEKMDEHLG